MVANPAVAAQKIAVEIDKTIQLAKAARMDVVVYVLETARMETLRAGDNSKSAPPAER
jgi:hypothetical protein